MVTQESLAAPPAIVGGFANRTIELYTEDHKREFKDLRETLENIEYILFIREKFTSHGVSSTGEWTFDQIDVLRQQFVVRKITTTAVFRFSI